MFKESKNVQISFLKFVVNYHMFLIRFICKKKKRCNPISFDEMPTASFTHTYILPIREVGNSNQDFSVVEADEPRNSRHSDEILDGQKRHKNKHLIRSRYTDKCRGRDHLEKPSCHLIDSLETL